MGMKDLIKNNISVKLQEFIRLESASGILMIIAAMIAIILANSQLSGFYEQLISYKFSAASIGISASIKDITKDLLMVLFFFVVGMELKKEMLEGFLSKRDQIVLPFLAAVAGMAVPAIIYTIFNADILATKSGWAIPSATDIAFALCVLSIFGRSVPPSIKILLLAIAIFDDLGAILIIAFFYSTGVHSFYLLLSAVVTVGMYAMNKKDVSIIWPYLVAGSVLVVLLEYAGIHTTIAGVITGLLIPLRGADSKVSPLNEAMQKLHPWVSFFILPLFAFVSAGVMLKGFDVSMVLSPVALGVACGLFIGKQIGIFGSIWLLVRFKFVNLPESATWKDIYAVSVLSGIGFTMSLFISQLAFLDPVFIEEAKLGVLAGSIFSAILGMIILNKKAG